jgi:uncharacterized membrane protein
MPNLPALEDPKHILTAGTMTPTVYPPLAEMFFRFVETIPGYKCLFTFFDAATILVLYLLLRKQGRPPHAVLVYAWNPCVLLSFPLFGHLDSLAIVTLFSAYLFLEMNWGTTSVVAFGTLGAFEILCGRIVAGFSQENRAQEIADFSGGDDFVLLALCFDRLAHLRRTVEFLARLGKQ